MRPASAALLALLSLLWIAAAVAADAPKKDGAAPEARVSFERKEDGVHYTIAIADPFKMNRKAPFKFELRGNGPEILRSVSLDEFAKEEKGETYHFRSTAGEKHLHYWFIACKYKGDEIVACKTFTAKEDVP